MEEVSSWKPRNLVERRISKLPCVRQARYRVDRGWVVLGNHSSYRQAIMAFTRGYIPNRPYRHCRDGHGPMTECVRLEADAEHFFSGARSNCHWGGQTSRCSFYLPSTQGANRVRSGGRSSTRSGGVWLHILLRDMAWSSKNQGQRAAKGLNDSGQSGKILNHKKIPLAVVAYAATVVSSLGSLFILHFTRNSCFRRTTKFFIHCHHHILKKKFPPAYVLMRANWHLLEAHAQVSEQNLLRNCHR